MVRKLLWGLLFVVGLAQGQFTSSQTGQQLLLCADLPNAWCVLRAYDGTVNPHPGGMLSFQTQNHAGRWLDALMMNGGLEDPTAGHEQGLLDIVFQVNGVYHTFAISGSYGGHQPGIKASPDGSLWLGSDTGRFGGLNLLERPCTKVPLGLGAKGCVEVNGGETPVWR